MALPEHISLEVVTPARQVLRETVEFVEIPGKDGYLGVLPGHAPLVTELGIGELTYRRGGDTGHLTVIEGFAEVLPERVIVLAEVSERAEEIDLERANLAVDRARERLAKAGSVEVDWERAALALERALIRQSVARQGGPRGS